MIENLEIAADKIKSSVKAHPTGLQRVIKNSFFWITTYALLIIITRIEFLQYEVIDWDESTFILMAQSVLDGHLPYVELFDIKPPMIYFMLAGAISIFGKSLLAVRIFGAVCILISSVLVMQIARRQSGPLAAGLAGLVVVALHAQPVAQFTSTELPATAMLLGALWFLITRRSSVSGMIFAGLLISLATLTRSNLAFVAVAFGFYLVLAGFFFPASRIQKWAIIPYTLAGLFPLALLIALYAWFDALPELRVGIFDVPLSYANNQHSFFETLIAHGRIWRSMIGNYPMIYGSFAYLTLMGIVVSIVGRKKNTWNSHNYLILCLMIGAITFSIFKGGVALSHYWLQVVPFGAILCAAALSKEHVSKGFRWIGYALVSISLMGAAYPTLRPGLEVLTRSEVLDERHYIRAAAEKIDAVRKPEDQIWALRAHIILWYLDMKPVSRVATQPSNMDIPAILDPLVKAGYIQTGEMERIYASKPEFIVTGARAENSHQYVAGPYNFRSFVTENYDVFHREKYLIIYRLKEK